MGDNKQQTLQQNQQQSCGCKSCWFQLRVVSLVSTKQTAKLEAAAWRINTHQLEASRWLEEGISAIKDFSLFTIDITWLLNCMMKSETKWSEMQGHEIKKNDHGFT